jgi:hypothetical protein
MFNFIHPRPVVDGRALVVKIVQQTASARQDTRTLVVGTVASSCSKMMQAGTAAAAPSRTQTISERQT